MTSSTVLLVDDEQNVRSALQRILSSEGHDILQAENAQEALNVLDHKAVKLVISDMRMPGMDGADLLKEVAKTHKGVRRMVLTGYGDLPRAIVAINEGRVHRYLTKPWDNDELKRVVAEELKAERSEQDQDHQIESLRFNVRQLSKMMDISANMLTGTEEMLRYSQYDALIRQQQVMSRFQTPLKTGLVGRVQKRTERVAIDMQLDRDAREVLKLAALLHRLGEFVLPNDLINKCWWDMTDVELQTYQSYPEISTSLIDSVDCELAQIISTHRQYVNGLGFPSIGADATPLAARILCAVTEYEEMILFKGHLVGACAIRKIMLAGAGKCYDANVIAALFRS